jgi:hypothetical protein
MYHGKTEKYGMLFRNCVSSSYCLPHTFFLIRPTVMSRYRHESLPSRAASSAVFLLPTTLAKRPPPPTPSSPTAPTTPLVPSGSLWFALVPFGSLSFSVVVRGSLWFALVIFGSLWFCMVLSGSLCFPLVLCGSLNQQLP